METGANANTWGNNTNTNLETLDAFSAGYLSKDVAGAADVTLTSNNADPTAEASNKVIEFTGTLTGDINVFVPAVESNYIFFNNTAGAFTLTIAPDGHVANGVAIVQGSHTIMYCTGNSITDLFANSLGNLSVKGTANVTGDFTVNSAVTVRANGQVDATSFTGNGAGLTGVDPFPSGTKMVFYQASAPTGWTQDTASALANTALSVVTGTGGGTGGSDSFYSTFGASRTLNTGAIPVSGSVSGSVGGTTLSTPQIPSHNHSVQAFATPQGTTPPPALPGVNVPGVGPVNVPTSSTGGNSSHNHPFSGSLSGASTANTPLTIPSMNVKYANVIIAAKD